LDEKFIPEMANYMWDHLMGEPDDLKVDDLISAIQAVRDMLFGMDEKTRNSI
jgi:acetoacetate decarboxylase